MRPLPRQREVRTGRTRHRPSFFGRRLILQIEVRIDSIDGLDYLEVPPMPGCRDLAAWSASEQERIAKAWRSVGTSWRDAELTDLRLEAA